MELKIARKLARLTQKQLADLAGIDDSAISRVENGDRDIGSLSYASVIRIARALNPEVRAEDLFPVPLITAAPDATETHDA